LEEAREETASKPSRCTPRPPRPSMSTSTAFCLRDTPPTITWTCATWSLPRRAARQPCAVETHGARWIRWDDIDEIRPDLRCAGCSRRRAVGARVTWGCTVGSRGARDDARLGRAFARRSSAACWHTARAGQCDAASHSATSCRNEQHLRANGDENSMAATHESPRVASERPLGALSKPVTRKMPRLPARRCLADRARPFSGEGGGGGGV